MDDIKNKFSAPDEPYLISRFIPHTYDPTVLAVVADEDDVYIAGVADQRIEKGTRFTGSFFPSVLDETIGRAIRLRYGDRLWGVTIELTTRFRKPIPLGQVIRVVGRITRETRRHFEGSGKVLLADGSVAAEAHGRYLKMPIERITDFDPQAEEWKVFESPEDPCVFEMHDDRPAR